MSIRWAPTLDDIDRYSVAKLVLNAFAGFYEGTGVSRDLLIPALANQIGAVGAELEHMIVALDEFGQPIGVAASYPVAEMALRQRASMVDILSSLPDDEAQKLLDASGHHMHEITPITTDSCYLARFAVRSDARGSGVAQHLFLRFREMAAPFDYLSLHVHSGNSRAIAFYKRQSMRFPQASMRSYLSMIGLRRP